MGILDAIFGSSASRVVEPTRRHASESNDVLDEFEPIVLDPNKSLDDFNGRPPIIFKNGIA